MRTILAIITLAVMALTGCNPNNLNANMSVNSNTSRNTVSFTPPEPIKPASSVDPNFKPCNPYFPLVPGSLRKYTINFSSGLVGNATVVVDQAEENGQKVFAETTQIVDTSGGMRKAEKTIRKYVCDGDRIQIISEKTDNRVEDRHDIVEAKYKNISVAMVGLADLGRQGTTWTYSFNQIFQSQGQPPVTPDEPVVVSYATQGREEVTVGAGKFKVVKLIRKVRDSEISEYYARGIGLVKRVGSEGTRWELKEYSGLSPLD